MSELPELILPESFDRLRHADVSNAAVLLADLWGSSEPSIDVRAGALRALVVLPAASLFESARAAFRAAARHSNLADVLAGEGALDRLLLDQLAANYKVSRRQGAIASGRLRLEFSAPLSLTIGRTDVFEANGMLFVPDKTYTVSAGSPSDNLAVETFQPVPNTSGYVFVDIGVVAVTEGINGNLAKGTEVELVRKNLHRFVRAYVTETFTGGLDNESNHDLIQRMVHGISAKVLSFRTNMQASLLEVFPDIRDSSIIGAGDDEMTRDKHTVFPGSTGGYADWYVATTRQLQTATYEFELSDPGVLAWRQFSPHEYGIYLTEADFPGLYWVTEILDAETNISCVITGQSKHSVEDAVDSVRIFTDEEAMFSAYQMTEVCFTGQPDLRRIKVSGS